MYESELGVNKDHGKALELYQLGVDKGCTFCINNLARMYIQMYDKQYYNKIRDLYQSGIEKKCNRSLDLLVNFYKNIFYDHQKSEIINYFIKINRQDKIYEIFNSEDAYII